MKLDQLAALLELSPQVIGVLAVPLTVLAIGLLIGWLLARRRETRLGRLGAGFVPLIWFTIGVVICIVLVELSALERAENRAWYYLPFFGGMFILPALVGSVIGGAITALLPKRRRRGGEG